MTRQDKLNKGQVLLDNLNNYRPLDKLIVKTTTTTTTTTTTNNNNNNPYFLR